MLLKNPDALSFQTVKLNTWNSKFKLSFQSLSYLCSWRCPWSFPWIRLVWSDTDYSRGCLGRKVIFLQPAILLWLSRAPQNCFFMLPIPHKNLKEHCLTFDTWNFWNCRIFFFLKKTSLNSRQVSDLLNSQWSWVDTCFCFCASIQLLK